MDYYKYNDISTHPGATYEEHGEWWWNDEACTANGPYKTQKKAHAAKVEYIEENLGD